MNNYIHQQRNRERALRLLARLRNHRNIRKISQETMAGHLAISQNAYSKIESGQSELTVTRLFDICNMLQVPVEELIADK